MSAPLFYPEFKEVIVNPNGWGSRKLEAIRQRRAELWTKGDKSSATHKGYLAALSWVEGTFPEFRGTAEERKQKGLPVDESFFQAEGI